MNNQKLIGLFRILRFELSFAAGTCVVLAEVLALGSIPTPTEGFCGFFAVFSVAASLLIHNDLIDIETDRINAPARPLPSGVVTPLEAGVLAGGLALTGMTSAALLGLTVFVTALLLLLVGVLYNWKLKKFGLLGNLVVGVSVGMSFIVGGIAVGRSREPVVLFLALLSMLVDLGEEIAADALDVEGDRRSGSRSLAVTFGPQKAIYISAAVFAVVIAGSFTPFITGWLGCIFFPPVVVFDAVIAWSVIQLLDPRKPQKIRYIRCIYLAGTAMLLALIVISIAA
jgi:geranylgeranylglycerol-phosphate geranylgeranyltransferase